MTRVSPMRRGRGLCEPVLARIDMSDYGSPVRFGLSVTPEAADIAAITDLTRVADVTGLDVVALQDHAYNHRFLDTWTLITFLAAKTDRVHFLPDVADLPLRPPAMLAKAAATLDQLTGGRAELAIGAGAFWDGIAGMGGPRRTPAEAVDATAEALDILRSALAANGRVVARGQHYDVRGYTPGPRPAHPMRIWVGAQKPRMLAHCRPAPSCNRVGVEGRQDRSRTPGPSCGTRWLPGSVPVAAARSPGPRGSAPVLR
jgi:hypothetical protein